MTVALTQRASSVMSVRLQQFVYTARQTQQSEKLPRGRGEPFIKLTSLRLKKCPERRSFFVLFCKSSRSSSGDGTPQNNLQHTSLLFAEIGQTSTKNFLLYRAASPVNFLDCEREPLENLPSETGRLWSLIEQLMPLTDGRFILRLVSYQTL